MTTQTPIFSLRKYHKNSSRRQRPVCRAWVLSAAIACAWCGSFEAAQGAELVAPRLTLDAFDNDAPGGAAIKDLSGFSLEQLMDIEVTSATRQKQRMSDVAAAMSVISHEDIRRTHYQNIPDLLSLAPGISVAQLNSGAWAIGSRGGGFRYTANLLVMFDGRSIYTPLFSGVTWNAIDYVIDDLSRIEVIRGPGATLWGANAVNGVISITSKDASETQGLLLDSYAGTDGLINTIRYGGKAGENTYYRLYAKTRDMSDFEISNGASNRDGWNQYRAGFRIDSNLSPDDKLTVQGDIYASRNGAEVVTPTSTPPFNSTIYGPFNSSGGNFLARYTKTISKTSDLTVQFYYDNYVNNGREAYGFDNSLNTLDLEMQHRFALGEKQEVIWGFDYRFSHAEIRNNPLTAFTTSRRHTDLQTISGFVQDDITLIPEHLHLVAGTKIEYDSITSEVEMQPSIRGIWTPDPKNTLWVAASRAARTPGLAETILRPTVGQIPQSSTTAMNIELSGDPNISSEHLMAYEAGYRTEPLKNLSVDLAVFYNTYDHSHGISTGAPFSRGGQMILPAQFSDDKSTQSWGFELASTWNVSDRLRISGSYSYLNIFKYGGKPSLLTLHDPNNQFKVQVYYDVTKDIALNSEFYWASRVATADIPSAFRWDIGATWRPEKHTELRAGVRNLLDNQHREFSGSSSTLPGGAEVPRTFYVELQMRF